PRPTTVTELRRFMGLACWHRQHIPKFATIAAPLYAMETTEALNASPVTAAAAKKSNKAHDTTPLVWTSEAESAFARLRQVLTEPPVIHVPSPHELDNRLRIFSDAHECSADGKQIGGVGGVLEWRDNDGNWRLVLAHSRGLTPAERNYMTTEVELLA